MPERDERGHFLPGNTIGQVPKATSKKGFNEAFRQATTGEEFAEVRQVLIDYILIKKNLKAIEIYLSYTMGKPTQSVEVQSHEGMTFTLAPTMGDAAEGA